MNQETENNDRRMVEDAEIRLKVKTREANWRIAFLALAFVFIVVGVVVPVWLDKADSDQRRADLDTIAQNTAELQKQAETIEGIVVRMDADDSPGAQRALELAVVQLVDVVRCDNRANLDDLLDELELRGVTITFPEDPLECVPPPTFTLPTTTVGG